MANPVDAIAGYWQQLFGAPAAANTVLGDLRNALADASEAASVMLGTGSEADPWRLALIGPLRSSFVRRPVLTSGSPRPPASTRSASAAP